MSGRKSIGLGILALLSGLLGLASMLPAEESPAAPGTIRIGLVRTLFHDLPESMVQMMAQPFSALMRSQTGLNGQIFPCGDTCDLGRRLHEGKMDLGVFHGIEFGWAQQMYPDLRPLVIAINKHRALIANVVVRNDSAAASFADLKGKVVALPRRSHEHSRLFLEHLCREGGAKPSAFLAKLAAPANVEDALDDVVRGKVQAAIVDDVSLECYEQVKSGCFARLKILMQSEIFPAGVVVYRQGALDDAMLTRFREGMINANQNERGRDLMSVWKLTAFEDVPADYPQTLANIVRAYPYAENGASLATGKAAPTD